MLHCHTVKCSSWADCLDCRLLRLLCTLVLHKLACAWSPSLEAVLLQCFSGNLLAQVDDRLRISADSLKKGHITDLPFFFFFLCGVSVCCSRLVFIIFNETVGLYWFLPHYMHNSVLTKQSCLKITVLSWGRLKTSYNLHLPLLQKFIFLCLSGFANRQRNNRY